MSVEKKRKVPVVEKKAFTLDKYKKTKGFDTDVALKPLKWIPASKTFQEAAGIPGIPVSSSSVIRGWSDTGKGTFMIELMVNCQKMKILPVIIITEQKWNWSHPKLMGFEVDETIDESTGAIDYSGFFIYIDRSKFQTVEQLGKIIFDILDDQEKGDLPYDICFFIDSFGKLNCDMGVDKGRYQVEWVASAIAHTFGAGVIPRIGLSKKETSKYSNTLFSITQPWLEKPTVYGAQPRMKSKGGESLPQDSDLIFNFGGVVNAGVSKLKAKKNKKEIVFGTRTRIEVYKNHCTMVTTKSTIISTAHGFIAEGEEKEYFKKHADFFMQQLGSENIDDIEFEEESIEESGEEILNNMSDE
jgi:hypothetical protein